jgi:hypothetical protein
MDIPEQYRQVYNSLVDKLAEVGDKLLSIVGEQDKNEVVIWGRNVKITIERPDPDIKKVVNNMIDEHNEEEDDEIRGIATDNY